MADDEDENLDSASPPRRRRRSKRAGASTLATGRSAIALYIVIGTIGLAALAAAIVGPKRVRSNVLDPLWDVVEPRARKTWEDSASVRKQMADLLEKAAPAERWKLVRIFRSWIEHLRAS